MENSSNKQALIGLALAVLVIVGFVLYHVGQGDASTTTGSAIPTVTATTTPLTPSSADQPLLQAPRGPHVLQGTPVRVTGAAAFEVSALVSTSTYPTLSGTATLPEVSIIVSNDTGRGLAGASHIGVVGGRWEYAVPVALTPGSYVITLVGGVQDVVGILTVK